MENPLSSTFFQNLCAIEPLNSQNFSQDVHSRLDQLLKILVEDKSSYSSKLNAVYFLEVNSSSLLQNVADIELVIATFENIFEASFNEKNQLLHGQSLIASTTILLEAFEKFSGGELDSILSQHVNALLELVHQANKPLNAYVRSVAASCLIEIELCFPLLLKPCLENIYAMAVVETSIAHQQYTSLLSLLVKHNLKNSQLGTPLWSKYPEIVLRSNFLGQKEVVSKSSLASNNQLMSFLVDQLPLCTSEGAVWITNHIIHMLHHNSELQAYCQVLKPLFFNYIFTYNAAEFHFLLSLERAFGTQLFVDHERRLFLQQLLLNCSHPSVSLSSRLVYLDFLDHYLSRTGYKLSSKEVSVILPDCFDGPEIKLKKFDLLTNALQHVEGTSRFLLKILNNMRNEIKCRNVKFKSAFMKALYKFFSEYDEIFSEEITRTILLATMEDVTITPFVLYFVQEVQSTSPESSLPSAILSSLVSVYTQLDSAVNVRNLSFVVEIFQGAVSQKCTSENVKSILVYLAKCVLKEDVCAVMPWALGHNILKLCYTLIKEYNPNYFYYELNNVLHGFASKCENEDIQDRARFYQGLLLSLSNRKLKAVLQGPRQALPHILSDESNFNPKASFQILEKPIVKIFKVNHAVPFSEKFDLTNIEGTGIAADYNNFIASNQNVKKLTVQIQVAMSDEFQEVHCVEALALFASAPEKWGEIDPIMIGHYRDSKEGSRENNESVDMVCHPCYPYPSEIRMRAEFSLENMCHMCSLEPFEIEFSDFFCPLPVSGEPNVINGCFEVLWTNIEKEFYSVIALEKSEEFIQDLVQKHFHSFIVKEGNNAVHVAVFLPPANHLLMKFCLGTTKTVVKLATDYINVLSYITVYFNKWM